MERQNPLASRAACAFATREDVQREPDPAGRSSSRSDQAVKTDSQPDEKNQTDRDLQDFFMESISD